MTNNEVADTNASIGYCSTDQDIIICMRTLVQALPMQFCVYIFCYRAYAGYRVHNPSNRHSKHGCSNNFDDYFNGLEASKKIQT